MTATSDDDVPSEIDDAGEGSISEDILDLAEPSLVEDYVDASDPYEKWQNYQDHGSLATFDALAIASLLRGTAFPSQGEIHTMAYLACLMSIYAGQPATEWGYSFSAVPPTLPFSPAIDGGLARLLGGGLIGVGGGYSGMGQAPIPGNYEVSATGEEEYAFLSSLSLFQLRLPYIVAATSSARLTSLPRVVNSLTNEPGLARATRTESSKRLLRESDSAPLYSQFEAIEAALGRTSSNLVVPAAVYLRLLDEEAREAIEIAHRLEDAL